jgi:hypothetical protein
MLSDKATFPGSDGAEIPEIALAIGELYLQGSGARRRGTATWIRFIGSAITGAEGSQESGLCAAAPSAVFRGFLDLLERTHSSRSQPPDNSSTWPESSREGAQGHAAGQDGFWRRYHRAGCFPARKGVAFDMAVIVLQRAVVAFVVSTLGTAQPRARRSALRDHQAAGRVPDVNDAVSDARSDGMVVICRFVLQEETVVCFPAPSGIQAGTYGTEFVIK